MKFNAQQYFHAAVERMEQARTLYRHHDCYALAMYVAGVAVECMLRAFKLRRTPVFDERHDLLLLLRESGILQLDEATMVAGGSLTIKRQDMHTTFGLRCREYTACGPTTSATPRKADCERS